MLASCVLVRPSNRSKLGLNPYNVHRNGRMIMQIGCDERQRQNAVLFEISRDVTTKAKQIAVNQNLIELSGGLLAPLTGMERGLSVGCGYFTTFVRAAQAHTNLALPTATSAFISASCAETPRSRSFSMRDGSGS